MNFNFNIFFLLVLCSNVCLVFGSSDPLYLSNYLPDRAAQARALSLVGPLPGNVSALAPSYSGYITVNQTTNSNLFFWLFEAQNRDPSAPLIAWFNGGPGSTSMYGLFTENGPIYVQPDGTAALRDVTWNENCHMVFIDNPVGTGWSFTESTEGFVTDQIEVADDLYSFFQQFYAVYPALLPNKLVIAAESYGGKYGPAISYRILQENMNLSSSSSSSIVPKTYINLYAMSIGDGMMDPRTQTQGMSAAWYQLSLIDRPEMAEGIGYEKRIRAFIDLGLFRQAFDEWDMYLNGDFYPYPTFYRNVTGLSSYYNYDTPVYPANPFVAWLEMPEVRSAIHVGDRAFWSYNATVERYLLNDWMQSVKDWMPTILDSIHVLLYNGQFDVILAAPQDEAFIRGLVWKGSTQYEEATRLVWKVNSADRDPAGYVKQALNFTQCIVRQAGHLVPQDQPERAKDMIERFIFGLPWH